ncbi:MAG: SOS response-associated peptidase [Patescibacteria group bacterium]
MCGRFDLQLPAEKLGVIYGADLALIGAWRPRYNVAPTQTVPLLLETSSGRVFRLARFGLTPSWSSQPQRQIINLRAETMQHKPFFRQQLTTHRCIIPATGFFEWQTSADRTKTPFRFSPTDRETFSLAGIWEEQSNRTMTFAIVTGPPNELLQPIHNRMPLILDHRRLDVWLNPTTAPDEIFGMMTVFPADQMRVQQVSKDVNNPANDTSAVVAPIN